MALLVLLNTKSLFVTELTPRVMGMSPPVTVMVVLPPLLVIDATVCSSA